MASSRTMTPDLVIWQTRGFHPFTEVIEVPIKAGSDKGMLPSDQDFKSDNTQIFGLRAFVNNSAGTAKSFLSKDKLMPLEMVDSAGVLLWESNSDKVYRLPLKKLVDTGDAPYLKLWLRGYSSKESHIQLGKPVDADCVVLLEITYV